LPSILIPDVWTFVLAVGRDTMISFATIKTKKCLSLAIIALLAVSMCGFIALSDSAQASATDPLISGVTGTAGTDTLEVTIGATVVNATTITIDYGDESTAATVTATDNVISSTYTYATAGTYTVTITATDGTVTDTATASYVTSTGIWTNNATASTSDGLLVNFVNDCGWIVIGGIIASVILGIIAAAIRFENPYVDLLVIISVVFTLVCWYYDITTFGAIWEQIKTFIDGLF